jgi:peptidoglycan/LPS O-acetylase OafA/YrhL
MQYRSDIDGLRAIAILSVVGFHAYPNLFRGGFIGVDVFFVISGYLITAIILNELTNDSFSLKDFPAAR